MIFLDESASEEIKKQIAELYPEIVERINTKNDVLNPVCEKCSKSIEFCDSTFCFYEELVRQKKITGPVYGFDCGDVSPEQFPRS
jgi:ribonucleotide reductase beta subunit family protein with ferritin-like domain